MKTIYFCFGDNRSGKKEYRIFTIRGMNDVHELVDALGLQLDLDTCPKRNTSSNLTERMVRSALEAVEVHLHGIENVVACWRTEYNVAQWLKRHFMSSDMSLYFPKILPEPEEVEVYGNKLKYARRTYPWITAYWTQKFSRRPITPIPVFHLLSDETMEMLTQCVRGK